MSQYFWLIVQLSIINDEKKFMVKIFIWWFLQKIYFYPDPKTQASLREFRETFAEEFCNFDGRSGLPTLCISAMI